MKKIALTTLAAVTLAASAGAAAAQPYGYRHAVSYNINQRQAEFDNRIDWGVRNGSLTRSEAARLHGEFRTVARLEARYRVGGLSAWERRDLDRRLDGLDANIRQQLHDGQMRHSHRR
jgi:hypothetical protein